MSPLGKYANEVKEDYFLNYVLLCNIINKTKRGDKQMSKKVLGTVILPGNYDPITVGHINSLRFLSERSDKVVAVIMTLASDEGKRWIPSKDMKELIEVALKDAGLNNVEVYIESEGWIAHSIEEFKANGVARTFHPNISMEAEQKFINAVIELDIPVHIIPSKLNVRATDIKFFVEESMLKEFSDLVPKNVYEYIAKHKCLNME